MSQNSQPKLPPTPKRYNVISSPWKPVVEFIDKNKKTIFLFFFFWLAIPSSCEEARKWMNEVYAEEPVLDTTGFDVDWEEFKIDIE